VSFRYDSGTQVFRNLDLDVRPGEVVALVGASGAGKTTIVNLLLGFYKPESGRILLDGVPLERFPLRMLRRQIGLVSQETFLFSGTVRDNIAYANLHATDNEIIAAARAANAHDFIVATPEGYQLEVGERGAQLSGGQRQRIAIARAILRNPKIMIFDEATSHLDCESERLIQEALETLSKGRTVFVVAHRLSTIRRADRIVVIEQGRIVEMGRHDELLARRGVYHKFHALQTSVA
jgi:ABC-type multidrug transport system fused ATPase/permease subunit